MGFQLVGNRDSMVILTLTWVCVSLLFGSPLGPRWEELLAFRSDEGVKQIRSGQPVMLAADGVVE